MKERKEMLFAYIKSNVAPILVDFITAKDLDNTVILPANVASRKLCGHYEGTEYMPPKWFSEIEKFDDVCILVIDKIDSISKEEQLKFGELLEYRKISTFELPSNCVIILTAEKINKDTISEEIMSLVARI